MDLVTPATKSKPQEPQKPKHNAAEVKPRYTAPPGFFNEWTQMQRQEWVDNNDDFSVKYTMPGGFVQGGEKKEERRQETAEEVAQSMQTPSTINLTPTPTFPSSKQQTGGQWQYDSDSSDSLEDEEAANVNPVRRKVNWRVEDNFVRTISPIKALSKSTTPEEDKIPVRKPERFTSKTEVVQIAPTREDRTPAKTGLAKQPKLASEPARSSEPTEKRQVLTDEICQDIVPAVPRAVISLEERRRLEDEYVDKKWDALERDSPITYYSAGPDSPIREVTPGKIEEVKIELAVICHERNRDRGGEELEPSGTHAHTIANTTDTTNTTTTTSRTNNKTLGTKGDPPTTITIITPTPTHRAAK